MIKLHNNIAIQIIINNNKSLTMASPTKGTATTTAATNWRDEVPQEYRSQEISKIATELSKLEKNATMQSKFALASRFENTMFAEAKSLAEYHKTIEKKLKKLKKKYNPTAAADGSDSGQNAIKEEINATRRNLRFLYGDIMKFIAENGKAAAKVAPNVFRLQDHIDKCNEYAFEIGAISSEQAVKITTGEPIVLPQRSPDATLKFLKNLERELGNAKRISLLRDHVLKYTSEEKFFGEKLELLERNMLLNTEEDCYQIFFKSLEDALRQEGINDLLNLSNEDIIKGIKAYQNKIRENVIIPRNKEDKKVASIAYLDKIRAASQICFLYALIMPNEQRTKLTFAGSLQYANDTVFESLKFLKDTYTEESTDDDITTTEGKMDVIKLEDAWNKILQYDSPPMLDNTDSGILDDVNAGTDEPEAKRPKTEDTTSKVNNKPLAIRAKVLLIGGRKPPSHLMHALRRKQALICQDKSAFGNAHLKLQFGESFEMLIYLLPLLVRMKAIAKPQSQEKSLRRYQVMGVSGDINTVGPLIAKQLDYSSAHATRCLRRCFADLAQRSHRTHSSDLETEILEGNALLKFLSIARNTYHPNWLDVELD